ncbi:MAG TPA: tetratricopeptide repeat protein [Candidatus Obscuribacterales bacterium]
MEEHANLTAECKKANQKVWICSLAAVVIAWTIGGCSADKTESKSTTVAFEDRLAGFEDAVKKKDFARADDEVGQLLEQAQHFGARDLRLIIALNRAAEYKRSRGEMARCRVLFERAVALSKEKLEKVIESKGAVPRPFGEEAAKSLVGLADLYAEKGQFRAAKSLYSRAIALEDRLGVDKSNPASACAHMERLMRKEISETEVLEKAWNKKTQAERPAVSGSRRTEFKNRVYAASRKADLKGFAVAEPELLALLKEAEHTFGPREEEHRVALNCLLANYMVARKYDKARVLLEQNIEKFSHVTIDSLNGDDPDAIFDGAILADDLISLAECFRGLKLYPQSVATAERAFKIIRKLHKPNDINHGRVYEELALTKEAQQLYEEALPYRAKQLAILEAKFPGNRSCFTCAHRFAKDLEAARHFDEATKVFAKCIQGFRYAKGDSMLLADSYNGYGNCSSELGRLDEAKAAFEKALEIVGRQNDPNPVLSTLRLFAKSEKKRANYPVLLRIYDQEECVLLKSSLPGKYSALAGVLHGRAEILAEQGQTAKCEEAIRRAIAYKKKDGGEKSVALAGLLNMLASNHSGRGQYAEAEKLQKQALKMCEEASPFRSDALASTHLQLAGTLIASKKLDEAREHILQAKALTKNDNDDRARGAYQQAGLTLVRLDLLKGDKAEARAELKKVLDALNTPAFSDLSVHGPLFLNAADHLQALGALQEAEPLYKKLYFYYKAHDDRVDSLRLMLLKHYASLLAVGNRQEEKAKIDAEYDRCQKILKTI